MVYNAFELVNAGPVRDVPFGSKASTDNKICGFGSSAIGSLDVPTSFVSVELSIDNDTFKSGLAFDVKDLVTCVEIIS